MRQETNNFEGKTLVLEAPEDVGKLRARDASEVPPAVMRLFVEYPRSFRALADQTTFGPLAKWLRRGAKTSPCELVIDRPGRRFARTDVKTSVVLRVGAGDDAVRISGPIARIPKRCPPPLAEVFRRIGVVQLEYGSSGGLIAPSEQRSLLDLYAEITTHWTAPSLIDTEEMLRPLYAELVKHGSVDGSLGFEAFAATIAAGREARAHEAANLARPAAPRSHFAFFVNACGSYLTTNAAGETWRVPMGGGDYAAGPPIDQWLARFFRPGFIWT
jgi:hypothetical protein